MGAPSPELCNLWLARAFNAQDIEAAAAMYHPEASIVQVGEVHGATRIARGSEAIRKTMAAYIGLKPHMDVVTHHTTIAVGECRRVTAVITCGGDDDYVVIPGIVNCSLQILAKARIAERH